MSRRIVTSVTESTGGSRIDDYAGRLVKYIPADVVAAWVTVSTLLAPSAVTGSGASNATSAAVSTPDYTTLWVVFAVFVLITAFWTWRTTQKPGAPVAKTQIIISTISFVVWVIGLGVPFSSLPLFQQQKALGAVVLIVWTLVAGKFVPPRSEELPAGQPPPPPPPQ